MPVLVPALLLGGCLAAYAWARYMKQTPAPQETEMAEVVQEEETWHDQVPLLAKRYSFTHWTFTFFYALFSTENWCRHMVQEGRK